MTWRLFSSITWVMLGVCLATSPWLMPCHPFVAWLSGMAVGALATSLYAGHLVNRGTSLFRER